MFAVVMVADLRPFWTQKVNLLLPNKPVLYAYFDRRFYYVCEIFGVDKLALSYR